MALDNPTHLRYRLHGQAIYGRKRKADFLFVDLLDVLIGNPIPEAEAVTLAQAAMVKAGVKPGYKLTVKVTPITRTSDNPKEFSQLLMDPSEVTIRLT